MRKLTHEGFLQKLREKNEHYRNGQFEVVGEYECSKCKILIKGKYGECLIQPISLLQQNSKPNIKSAIDKTEYFKSILEDKNIYFKNKKFEVVGEYIKDKTNILCKTTCGFCNTTPNMLLSGHLPTIQSAIDKNLYFENMAREVHGDKYDYSKVEYVKAHDKVKIICPEHGEFEQEGHEHLRGNSCPKCTVRGWSLNDWKQMCPGNPGIFYILRCWNDDEEFYKVGITCQSDVSLRYHKKSSLPYNYEIVKEVVDFDRERIWNLEKTYLSLLKEYHYEPKLKFGGSTKECFKTIKFKNE